MSEATIKQLLHELSELGARRDLGRMDKQAAIEAATPPEVKIALLAIESTYETAAAEIAASITDLESRIKAMVTEHGATVKGEGVQAVYMAGRVTWDAKALDGFALNHPELFGFRTEGKPSVSLRTVKRT